MGAMFGEQNQRSERRTMTVTIPDPLVIRVTRPPAPPHDISVARLPGESETDHVHRACRIVLQWLKDNPAPKADELSCEKLDIDVFRSTDESDVDFVADLSAQLIAQITP